MSSKIMKDDDNMDSNGLQCVTKKSEVDRLYDNLAFIYGEYAVGRQQRRPTRRSVTVKTSQVKGKVLKTARKKFGAGDFVIGDIKSFGWWFGKIVTRKSKPSSKNLVWVYWYGDHKILEFPYNYLISYKEFGTVFERGKMKRSLYCKAVKEFINEVQTYHKKWNLELPDTTSLQKNKVFSRLLEWAIDGFEISLINSSEEDLDQLPENDNNIHRLSLSESSSVSVVILEDPGNSKLLEEKKSKEGKEQTMSSKQDFTTTLVQEVSMPLEDSSIEDVITSTKASCKTYETPHVDFNLWNPYSEKPCNIIDAMECGSHTSTGTICYGMYNPPKCPKKSTEKLTKGGILLDSNLIGSTPSRRKCTTKAEENKKPKKKKKKKKKKDLRQKTIYSSLMDLPVMESTSKVLSWKSKISPASHHAIPSDKHLLDIRVEDLVIAKLKGFDWWFGKVISYKQARKSPSPEGMCWLYWFGDHKLSQIPLNTIEHLDKFPERFLPRKMRGCYLDSVEEVLNEAALRSNKHDLPDRFDDTLRLRALIHWALDGFQPLGISGFRGLEDDDIETESSTTGNQADDDENATKPLLSIDVKALFDKVAKGYASIEGLCLACGDTKVHMQHPLFHGGLCKECKETFLECAYLYDDNGYQMYCCICSDGDHIICCDNLGCSRSYCPVCIDMLCGVGYTKEISSKETWECFMCSGENVRLLRLRHDWQERVKQIFVQEEIGVDYPPQPQFVPIAHDQRKPIRVLSLFDGISTACLVLKKLNIAIEVYVASEIDDDAKKVSLVHHGQNITHVGDICKISRADIEEWGPFDLLIGGSPCNDLSIANPARKGIYEGTGRLFFEFFRILQYTFPTATVCRPFFWFFENVVGMRHIDKEVISRFLQCNPVVISAKDVSAQRRTRFFWGNLPGMNRPLFNFTDRNLVLQDCLEQNCGRVAKFEKVGCITTKRLSLHQTKNSSLPVELDSSMEEDEDELWVTEIERIFGFPDHYTDVGNMGQKQRQRLLGKSWSVPVVEHLLMPLKDFFKLNEE